MNDYYRQFLSQTRQFQTVETVGTPLDSFDSPETVRAEQKPYAEPVPRSRCKCGRLEQIGTYCTGCGELIYDYAEILDAEAIAEREAIRLEGCGLL